MRIIRNKEGRFRNIARILRPIDTLSSIPMPVPGCFDIPTAFSRPTGRSARESLRPSGYDGPQHSLTQGDSVTVPANTRRRLAPATIMTLALLGSLALLVTFVLQVAAAAPPRGMDEARAELLVVLEEDAAKLPRENAAVKIQPETLEILDRTADGAIAFAFLTTEDRLGLGVRGEDPSAYAWQLGAPTEKAGSLNATLTGSGTDKQQYELSVRRSGSGSGFEHTFTEL